MGRRAIQAADDPGDPAGQDLKEVDDASRRAILEDQISQEERQATGIAKAPYVSAFVRTLLDGGESVLLFAHHHKVMDLYKKELRAYRPAFITGRENEKQKDEALNRFMSGRTVCA